jgi:hypothetical protein
MNRNPAIHRQPSGDVDIAFVDAAVPEHTPAETGASPAAAPGQTAPVDASPPPPGEPGF